jgi:hypothetical protein
MSMIYVMVYILVLYIMLQNFTCPKILHALQSTVLPLVYVYFVTLSKLWFKVYLCSNGRAYGSVIGWSTMLQAGRSHYISQLT